ncbi:MAG: hypothetical protein ABSG32_12030 [Terriglobia bacterium]|jgi:hypothetical protein
MFNLLSRRSVSRVLGSPVCTALSAEDGPEQSMAAESCCDTDPEELLRSILRSLGRTINCLFAAPDIFGGGGIFHHGQETIPLGCQAGRRKRPLFDVCDLLKGLSSRKALARDYTPAACRFTSRLR